MMRKLLRSTGGSSTVDFAFALPVLVVMMIGIMQMGLTLHASGAMRHAVGEGIRLAKVDPTASQSDIEAEVKDEMTALDLDKIVTLEVTRGTSNGVAFGRIRLQYRVDPVIQLLPVPAITLTEEKQAYIPA